MQAVTLRGLDHVEVKPFEDEEGPLRLAGSGPTGESTAEWWIKVTGQFLGVIGTKRDQDPANSNPTCLRTSQGLLE